MKFGKPALNFLLDLLFPPLCLACLKSLEKSDGYLCLQCFGSIEINSSFFSGLNGRRIPYGLELKIPKNDFLLASASSYNDRVVKKLIWRLKFKKEAAASKSLAFILKSYIDRLGFDFSDYCLVAIPLHKKRERWRSFNQAQLIARELSSLSGIDFSEKALLRIRETKVQSQLSDLKARRLNLEQAFSTGKTNLVFGRKILLLDDVFTTGATMSEAVKTIREAGAIDVVALVVAKT